MVPRADFLVLRRLFDLARDNRPATRPALEERTGLEPDELDVVLRELERSGLVTPESHRLTMAGLTVGAAVGARAIGLEPKPPRVSSVRRRRKRVVAA
ncbi:MAG: hypothetical protein FJ096_00035 [Deltaproteobacteria bacterium]|nr:hypothetical protein [Deltaproteobacteria bacterium]